MSTISIELKKYRRSGIVPALFAPGILGFLYSVVVFILRKETLLSLPLPPMTILLTQLYGVVMLLNLFGIVVSSSLMFNIEYQGNAIRKIASMPMNMVDVYIAKFAIVTFALFLNIVLQSVALWYIGTTYLPNGAFEVFPLITNTVFYLVVAMPAVAFMVLLASRLENIWISLGIGVAGFISGLTMSTNQIALFLINPFVIIMQPALSSTAEFDGAVLAVSVVELILLFFAGLLTAKHFKHE